MPTSRLKEFRDRIATHISAQISGVMLFYDPISIEDLGEDSFPCAVVISQEEEPTELDFKQERRRMIVDVVVGFTPSSGESAVDLREALDLAVQNLRDALFADPNLSTTVDGCLVGAATTFQGRDDPRIYSQFSIVADEVF